MKTSLIKIRQIFGISQCDLSGQSVEITGPKGAGKTSVLDAIRYALTNRSNRDYIVKQGADEGEIIIETDTGLKIDRKRKADMDTSSLGLKDNGLNVPRPQSFLENVFTTLQLNPVEFIGKPQQEQNRMILDLIEYPWTLETIREWFGELPSGVDYKQNILQVLNDIQAERGVYYQTRQNINHDLKYKKESAEEIGKIIPDGYKVDFWEAYDTGEKYAELSKIQQENSKIERAKAFKSSYDNKLRGLEADREIAINNVKTAIESERSTLRSTIERLKAEIVAAEDKIRGLDTRLDDKVKLAQADFETAKAKLDADIGIADKYADKEPTPTTALQEEIAQAEAMKKHINEYRRMERMQQEVDELQVKSDALTEKIELARSLPGQILAEATIPVEGLTVKNGIPLVNGRPLSNLSDGEKLDLCVDVTIAKKHDDVLQIILIDGAERLDEKSRKELYEKCKAKGLQLIATRTTDGEGLAVTEL